MNNAKVFDRSGHDRKCRGMDSRQGRIARRIFAAMIVVMLGGSASAKTPVLFLHGWNGKASNYDTMRSLLQSDAGYSPSELNAFDYERSGVDIQDHARRVADEIVRYSSANGGSAVDIVAHSMGGLVVREILRSRSDAAVRIRRLVTLGTPHYGQNNAEGTSATQMHYGSRYLYELAQAWTDGYRLPAGNVLSIVGRDGTANTDGLVDAWSASLEGTVVRYVNRTHTSLTHPFWGAPVIYECGEGVNDSVYRLVKSFLENGTVLSQATLDSTAPTNVGGSILFQIVDESRNPLRSTFEVVSVYAESAGEWTRFREYKTHWAEDEGDEVSVGQITSSDEHALTDLFSGYLGLPAGTYRILFQETSGSGRFFASPAIRVENNKTTVVQIPVSPGMDVALVIDSTGSMSGAISAAKSSAVAIVNEILGESSGAVAGTQNRVAVVEYRDKTSVDPFVYRVNAAFTSDASTAIAAIDAISLGDGGDRPEALYAALRGVAVGAAGAWTNPERHVIVMTDAPAHDPDLETGDTLASITKLLGGVSATSKAETFRETLKADSGGAGVHVHVVYLGSDATTSETFNELADSTGGTCQTGVAPSEAADAILDVLTTIKEAGSSSLAAAVDNTALSFTTGGDAEWYSQSYTTYDGIDAARSGYVGDYGETWMRATGATGAGIVSFRWRVSSERGYDWIEFYVDGEFKFGWSGTDSGWRQEAFKIASGSHTFEWLYVKDGSVSVGSDCAWVDQVKWTPSSPLSPVYRFYSSVYKGHFFTMSESEMANLVDTNPNWRYEGVAYYAYPSAASGTAGLYRFYSKGYRGHFYTTDYDEYWTVRYTNPNWKYEQVAYYVRTYSGYGSTPVYRFWSKEYRHHFYTTDYDEYLTVRYTNPHWAYEGVAFYAWAEPDSLSTYSYASSGGKAVAAPVFEGVTAAGDWTVETRFDAPGADELAEARSFDGPFEVPELSVALPEGTVSATAWSASAGTVSEGESPDGAIVFRPAAPGDWTWVRAFDADGAETVSLWLRLLP